MTADREPEVRPELISDLDLTDDDADYIAGGCIGGIRLQASRGVE